MMKIAFFSSEVYPFAKTGGLADVAGALPIALGNMGHEVKVFMPLYRDVEPQELNDAWGRTKLSDNVEIIFIRHDLFYNREYLYNMPNGDYADNLLRFSYFCKAAFDWIRRNEFKADIYHANDWQTALVPLLLKTKSRIDDFFVDAKALFTIHNLAFQGCFDLRKFESLALAPDCEGILEMDGCLNLVKGATLAAHAVNTVSKEHAKEIASHDFGSNLQYIFQLVAPKLSGIVNGIDYDVWNPATDDKIAKNFKKSTIDDKAENKKALIKELGLKKRRSGMLVGVVSRLTQQKGIDVLLQALPEMLKKHNVVVLGSGEQHYHDALAELKNEYGNAIEVIHEHNEELAHKIYAASDMVAMPSRFEPCGLPQLIAFRYGALPLVHATGGLKETVKEAAKDGSKGNGFLFERLTQGHLLEVFNEAQEIYKDEKAWKALTQRAMGANYSWKKAAKSYDDLYKKMTGKKK